MTASTTTDCLMKRRMKPVGITKSRVMRGSRNIRYRTVGIGILHNTKHPIIIIVLIMVMWVLTA
ncbi:MAG: hypothetical protein K8R25_01790 [Methanosarcinales archaeon]|nr:hypothetical protein [Methanosarcinales archaeon]